MANLKARLYPYLPVLIAVVGVVTDVGNGWRST
ncbi:MAG: hypothetical protein QOJ63_396 [Solirubrobacteraceae bacterium]|jgi:hypothetical protein|nr:hypothetical protein [Solirubrobacteraceae bacterium]